MFVGSHSYSYNVNGHQCSTASGYRWPRIFNNTRYTGTGQPAAVCVPRWRQRSSRSLKSVLHLGEKLTTNFCTQKYQRYQIVQRYDVKVTCGSTNLKLTTQACSFHLWSKYLWRNAQLAKNFTVEVYSSLKREKSKTEEVIIIQHYYKMMDLISYGLCNQMPGLVCFRL